VKSVRKKEWGKGVLIGRHTVGNILDSQVIKIPPGASYFLPAKKTLGFLSSSFILSLIVGEGFLSLWPSYVFIF
jgi:hypothetical protein